MRIDSLRLINFRGFEDFSISFNSDFNVIVGVNGAGKTSVLLAAYAALCGHTNYIPNASGGQILSDGNDARYIVTSNASGGSVRFEPQYPVSVEANGTVEAKAVRWKFERDPMGSIAIEGKAPGTQVSAVVGRAWALTLFYRASRTWAFQLGTELNASTRRYSRFDAYEVWFDASAASATLLNWVVAQSIERYQLAAERGVSFSSIEDDELHAVNVALASAIDGVAGLRYDTRLKSVFLDWATGSPLGEQRSVAFEHLSDGQRAVVGLVADIARRACLLNPQLGTANSTKETPGVVLIDELDLHLHPSWQRRVTTSLRKAFPQLQFITTSHSPQIISELYPQDIILLSGQSTTHPETSYGLDSSRVLEIVMDAPSRSPEVEAALASVFDTIERGDLGSAKRLLGQLTEIAPNLPEAVRAEALIQRKEVLGR